MTTTSPRRPSKPSAARCERRALETAPPPARPRRRASCDPPHPPLGGEGSTRHPLRMYLRNPRRSGTGPCRFRKSFSTAGDRAVRVAVADYGAGNLRSLCAALSRAGAEPFVTVDPAEVRSAPLAVVAGVG